MIVKGIILILLIFAALVFLAVKMSESIVKAELKMFFFGLFFVTILTLFNIILSAYFVIKAKDKTGPRGRKGRKGIIGDPGEDGECNESCKANSVHQLMIKKNQDDKYLCDFKKQIENQLNTYTLDQNAQCGSSDSKLNFKCFKNFLEEDESNEYLFIKQNGTVESENLRDYFNITNIQDPLSTGKCN